MTSSLTSAATAVLEATAAATTSAASASERPPVYKAVGVSLAIASGLFIGVSFVLKKKGLLLANMKDGTEAGEGYGYLKNAYWWGGMTLMIIGEICNFCAYAFVEAILVTPLGALSVVITAILSSIFLHERLSFVGKIGCFMCIVGSIVIVINAPEQSSASTIQEMRKFVIAPGFLSYAGVVILGCVGIVVWIAPKYGAQSMMVYISVCSLIGGLSVVATQGLGAAVVTQISGTPQFNQWFLYVLFVFVVITLLVEIIYLNKALNIFNAALVTPTYYVCFTSSTIITSAVLFQGFKGTASSIATVVMGFLQICAGVVLLQLSKSAKNVPDTEIFRGDLDQVRAVAEQSEPESEPKADTIRGTAAIIRRISVARQKLEAEEAKRAAEDRVRELNGEVEIRRRVTWGGNVENPGRRRRNTLSGNHTPRMPDLEEGFETVEPAAVAATAAVAGRRRSMSVDEGMRRQLYEKGMSDEEEDSEQEQNPQTLVEKVKNLFIPKVRSRSSLREQSEEVVEVVVSPHRDLRDSGAGAGTGLGVYLERNKSTLSPEAAEEKTFLSPASDHFPTTRDFAASLHSPVSNRSRPSSPWKTPEVEYVEVPSSTRVPPGTSQSQHSGQRLSERESPRLRPLSANSGRRQFSLQGMFTRQHHHHGHEGGDIGRRSGGGRSEEEMLGLVKGDSRDSEGSGVSCGSEDEKGDL
ncbi:hypothetical protein RUND412_007997 [Rhizina undulata]